MDFPFGHPSHGRSHGHSHGHHRRDDDDDESRRNREYPPPGSTLPRDVYDPPPQRFYGGGEFPPVPPPLSSHGYHPSHLPPPSSYPPPPPQDFAPDYSSYPPPPPPASSTVHVAHGFDHRSTPAAVAPGGSYFAKKPTFKVYCKADPNFALTIRDAKVILAPSDPFDTYQHWYKDEKYSTRVKDEEGFPCFALVNKATGEAMKHSFGASHPVQLIPYNPDQLDTSIQWTQSKDLGDGYRTIRMVNNVRLNVDAFHGDRHSGGVRDGTTIVLWEWNKGDNQRWKIVPY